MRHDLLYRSGELNVRRIVWLALPVLLLAACELRLHVDTVVQEDATGTLTMELSADRELRSLAGDEWQSLGIDILDFSDIFASEHVEVQPISDGDFQGWRISGPIGGSSDIGDVTLTREEDIVAFRLRMGGNGFSDQGGFDEFGTLLVDQMLDIRFRLTMPGEIIAHNADVVEGNTLVWYPLASNLPSLTMEARSQIPGRSLTLFVVVGLVLTAIVGAFVMGRRGRHPSSSVLAEEPVPNSWDDGVDLTDRNAPPVDPTTR